MKVLDTDILTLLFQAQPKVVERRRQETENVVITVFSHIEVLKGRFATLLKAANGAELKKGQQRLDQAERDLRAFDVLPVTDAVANNLTNFCVLGRPNRFGAPIC
jgi:predicted nucleic acid-binding protein